MRELVDRCRRTLDRALAAGSTHQVAEQRAWLDGFWARTDIAVDGTPTVQQAIRWNLFQMAQASAQIGGRGIAAKGVTASGYDGHYFWDTEIYMVCRSWRTRTRTPPAELLHFRYRTLPAARERASEMSQRGALFPWRTINGEEASAYYAAGTAQYHIDADIAYAIDRVRHGHRRHRVPPRRGRRDARRDGAAVGRPRVLRRRPIQPCSTSTA